MQARSAPPGPEPRPPHRFEDELVLPIGPCTSASPPAPLQRARGAGQSDAAPPSSDGSATPPSAAPPKRVAQRVLLVDVEHALAELLSAWLVDDGLSVVRVGEPARVDDEAIDLVIFDLPFPRQGGAQRVQGIAAQHAGVPILVLSSTVFPGIDCHGPMARGLGAACVLPNPASRGVLIGAVRRVLLRSCDATRAAGPADGGVDSGRA